MVNKRRSDVWNYAAGCLGKINKHEIILGIQVIALGFIYNPDPIHFLRNGIWKNPRGLFRPGSSASESVAA